MSATIKHYTIGLLTDNKRIVLVRKNRPDWQKGKLNFVGGHVEQGESSYEAQVREFEEEAGLYVRNWCHYATIDCPGARIDVFVAYINSAILGSVKSVTDEEIVILPIDSIANRKDLLPNLQWLIPLGLQSWKYSLPIRIWANQDT